MLVQSLEALDVASSSLNSLDDDLGEIKAYLNSEGRDARNLVKFAIPVHDEGWQTVTGRKTRQSKTQQSHQPFRSAGPPPHAKPPRNQTANRANTQTKSINRTGNTFVTKGPSANQSHVSDTSPLKAMREVTTPSSKQSTKGSHVQTLTKPAEKIPFKESDGYASSERDRPKPPVQLRKTYSDVLIKPSSLLNDKPATSKVKETAYQHAQGDFALDILIRTLEEIHRMCKLGTNDGLRNRTKSILTDWTHQFDRINEHGTTSQKPSLKPEIPPTPTSPDLLLPTDHHSASQYSDTDATFANDDVEEDAEAGSKIAQAAESEFGKGLDAPKPLFRSPAMRTMERSPVRLMSPPISRKTPSPESWELKQAKARELRASLQQSKAEKLKSNAEKFHAARERKERSELEQLNSLKVSLEEKQARAEKKREMHLRAIQDRAKDEEKKVDEISFIQNFSVENKRLDTRQRFRDFALRLTHLELERIRKSEESAAMQEAATERRRLQEAARAERVKRDEERMKEAERKREDERRERERVGREKEEEKARRLEALKNTRQAEEDEMRRELETKLLKSSQRKDEQMRAVKERAAAANQNAKMVASRVHAARGASAGTTPERGSPFGWGNGDGVGSAGGGESACLVCQAEVSPGEGGEHLHERHEVGVEGGVGGGFGRASPTPLKWGVGDSGAPPSSPPLDKTLKKRLKKHRKNMSTASSDDFHYISLPAPEKSTTLSKRLRQKVSRVVPLLGSVVAEGREGGELVSGWEGRARDLEEVILGGGGEVVGYLSVVVQGGLCEGLVKAVGCVDGGGRVVLSSRSIDLASSIMHTIISRPSTLSYFILHPSLYFVDVVGCLGRVLGMCTPRVGEEGWLRAAGGLMRVLVGWFRGGVEEVKGGGVGRMRGEGVIYLLLIGIIDRLREFMRVVHGPIAETSQLHRFLLLSAELLEAVTSTNTQSTLPIWHPTPPSVRKSLLCEAFRGDLVGLVTMLDSIIFYKGATGGDVGVEEVDERVVRLTVGVLRVLGNVCWVELGLVQGILMEEGMQSEFFHLCTFWVKYWFARSPSSISCVDYYPSRSRFLPTPDSDNEPHLLDTLLAELVLLLGYMCIDEPRGREMLRFGPGPVLLKLLCGLPFGYFVEPRLQTILLPTLVVAIHEDENNRVIVQEDVSLEFLVRFVRGAVEGGGAGEREEGWDGRFDVRMRCRDLQGFLRGVEEVG
ncbi:hypothetical protein HDV00_009426 [Rhizophlyctis rosea]|nr:hypothetical protein HDV00_009426 [Rhizophlyctis rosea]